MQESSTEDELGLHTSMEETPKDPFWGLLQLDAAVIEKEVQNTARKRMLNASGLNDPLTTCVLNCSPEGPNTAVTSEHTDAVTSSTDTVRKRLNYVDVDDLNKRNHVTENGIDENEATSGCEDQTAPVSNECGEVVDKEVAEETMQSAKVRFLWSKTIPTQANSVFASVPFQKDPIELQLGSKKNVYQSSELEVACGDYSCQLQLDSHDYDTEPVQIRNYTFDVDLFAIEEEEKKPEQVEKADRCNLDTEEESLPIQVTSTPKKSAPQPSMADLEVANEEDLLETASVKSDSSIRRSHMYEALLRQQMANGAKDKFNMEDDDQLGRSGYLSPDTSMHKSFRADSESPEKDANFSRDGSHFSNRERLEYSHTDQDRRHLAANQSDASAGSVYSSADLGHKHIRSDESNNMLGDVPKRGEGNQSARLDSKSSNEQDLSRYKRDQDSPGRDRDVRSGGDYRSSDSRRLTQDRYSERRQSEERLTSHYISRNTSQDVRNTSDRKSDSMARSRSLECGYPLPRSSDRSVNFARDEGFSHKTDDVIHNRDDVKHKFDDDKHRNESALSRTRSGSPSRHRAENEKPRSHADGVMVNGQSSYSSHEMTSRSTRTDASSSHTSSYRKQIPELSFSERKKDSQDQRLQDLETTVASLRRVLTDRDGDKQHTQMSDRSQDRKEQKDEEVSQSSAIIGPYKPLAQLTQEEVERKMNDLIREKENMATEVWKLKQELEKTTVRSGDIDAGQNKVQTDRTGLDTVHKESSGLDSYDPNSPHVLQRKIDDLKSQLQDLQEAHHTAVNGIEKLEHEMVLLRKENESLKAARALSHRGLQEENKTLRDQLERLTSEHASTLVQREDAEELQDEVRQMRSDLRALRDKNHQLVQDNIKLTEYLSDLERKNLVSQSRLEVSTETEKSQRIHSSFPAITPTERNHRRRLSAGSDSTAELTTAPPMGHNRDKSPLATSPLRFQSTERLTEKLSSDISRVPIDFKSDYRSPPKKPVDDVLDDVSKSLADRYAKRKNDVIDDVVDRRRYPAISSPADVRESSSSPIHRTPIHSTPTKSAKIATYVDDYSAPQTTQDARISSDMFDFDEKSYPLLSKSEDLDTFSSRHGKSDVRQSRADELYSMNIDEDEKFDGVENSNYKQPVVNGFRGRSGSLDSNCTELILQEAEMEVVRNSPQRDPELKQVAEQSEVYLNRPMSSTYRSLDYSSKLASTPRSSLALSSPALNTSTRSLPLGSPGLNTSSRSLGHCPSPQSCSPNHSFRSVSPKPTVTQHNKHVMGSPGHDSLEYSTIGKRPFAPRSPADIQLGDIVKFSRQGGKISKGVAKYIGHLPGKNDSYLGVELDHEMGKHDGVYNDVRYFQCKPNKGVFVAFHKIVLAWGR